MAVGAQNSKGYSRKAVKSSSIISEEYDKIPEQQTVSKSSVIVIWKLIFILILEINILWKSVNLKIINLDLNANLKLNNDLDSFKIFLTFIFWQIRYIKYLIF